MLKKQKFITGILLILMLMQLSIPVHAITVDTMRDSNIEISYKIDEKPVTNIAFYLYHVAEINTSGQLQKTAAFANYAIELNVYDTDALSTLAYTLASYVLRDHITPFDTGKTDTDGKLCFPNQTENLTPGLYLITGDIHTVENNRYTPVPTLIHIPYTNTDGLFDYHASIQIKHHIETIPDGNDDNTITRKVLKVWVDNEQTDRPNSIEIQLLKNGNIIDTVKLSENNNWRYTWHNLSPNGQYTVTEKTVPEQYTVTLTKQGGTFVLTNTHITTPPTEPIDPVDPKPTNPPADPIPNPTPKPDTPPEKLTQTGLLVWPLVLMAFFSILLANIGLICFCKRKYQYGVMSMSASLLLVIVLSISIDTYLSESNQAELAANEILQKIDKHIQTDDELIPDYIIDPTRAMPEIEIDGNRYIGTISIPSVDIELPIISNLNSEQLKIAPCRYSGSAYENNLIIAGHNYASHFGPLNQIAVGETILFTDIDGNVFTYKIIKTEIIDQYDVQAMHDGNWDMTLFTCTPGGRQRMTIRCEKQEMDKHENNVPTNNA